MFQVRSETTGIHEFSALANAIAETKRDPTIWKISWYNTDSGEQIRLVKQMDYKSRDMWVLSNLMDEVREELKVAGMELPAGWHGIIDG